jgi:hypothetical protein
MGISGPPRFDARPLGASHRGDTCFRWAGQERSPGVQMVLATLSRHC